MFDENSFLARDKSCTSLDRNNKMSTSLFRISCSIPLLEIPRLHTSTTAYENNTIPKIQSNTILPDNESPTFFMSENPGDLYTKPLSSHEQTIPDPQPAQTTPQELPENIIITQSKIGNSKPKEFPRFKMFYSTRHPFRCLTSILIESKPIFYT